MFFSRPILTHVCKIFYYKKQALTVEWASLKNNGKEEIRKYMEEQGYASLNFQYDFIFARRLHSDK